MTGCRPSSTPTTTASSRRDNNASEADVKHRIPRSREGRRRQHMSGSLPDDRAPLNGRCDPELIAPCCSCSWFTNSADRDPASPNPSFSSPGPQHPRIPDNMTPRRRPVLTRHRLASRMPNGVRGVRTARTASTQPTWRAPSHFQDCGPLAGFYNYRSGAVGVSLDLDVRGPRVFRPLVAMRTARWCHENCPACSCGWRVSPVVCGRDDGLVDEAGTGRHIRGRLSRGRCRSTTP